MKSDFLGLPLPVVLAHRAGGIGLRQNSIEAIAECLTNGILAVETDVRTTADGVVVLAHDRIFQTEDGRRITISQARLEVLRSHGCSEDRLPRLSSVLNAFPSMRFNIDLKDERSVATVPEVVCTANAAARVCVTSFSDRRIMRARSLLPPDVVTGFGTLRGTRLWLASKLALSGDLAALIEQSSVAQLPLTRGPIPVITREFVSYAHERGLQVHAWTVNDAGKMRQALSLGVDGLVTDYPLLARDIVSEHRNRENP